MNSSDERVSGVVVEIAEHLCAAAIRDAGTCTWLGTTQNADESTDLVEFRYGTVGSDLYGGSSGIALFLAEASHRLGDSSWGDAAAAGIHHALDRTDTMGAGQQVAFYTGTVGVAYAAARIGRILHRPEIVDRACRVLDHCPWGAATLMVDLISGGTGSMAPLLVLAEWLDRPALRDAAITLGQRTIDVALKAPQGWSWPVETGAIEATRSLTGLAHGAAGIGWSLLEVGNATGDEAFVDAAHQAFRYENQWFRPGEDNWPDFREEDGDDAPVCEAWCHGAPGIGLARLRAVELQLPEYRGDAAAALRTTRSALASGGHGREDFSLCHGRSGLMEILKYGGRVLGEGGDEAMIREVTLAAADRYGASDWPVGVRRGGNPSLMLGLAGIGYCYLGLISPDLPSVLQVRPDKGTG